MAALPQFYYDGALEQGATIWLDEDTVRHVVQVLRMQPGRPIQLTNGRGYTATCIITKAEKKNCSVLVEAVAYHAPAHTALHLAVAFTKNASRNEWLLEKATELGVSSIIPLQAARTEREKIRYDRWHNIIVAALLQSQQYYLPALHELTPLSAVLQQFAQVPQRLMGHCIDGLNKVPLADILKQGLETIILIGPEGDFTEEEVHLCMQHGFAGIDLGSQRLRTETAAMSCCAFFNLMNHG